MEKWERNLKSMLSRKVQTLERHSENFINRRIGGYPGGDQEYQSFRTGILYMQLSPEIDTEIIKKAVQVLKRFIHPGRSDGYATLFLNNSDYKLIYPRSMLGKITAVHKTIDEYYSKYALSNQIYSTELKQLFPLINPYLRKRYPSREDICLVFYDKSGFKINEKILTSVTRQRRNWIWIYAQKGDEVKITFNKIPEEINSANKQANNLENMNTISVSLPDNFYLYKKEYGTWQGNNEVEIKSNGEVVVQQMYNEQKYQIPQKRVYHLWKRLLELRVFNLKSNYDDPDLVVMDGTSWEFVVEGGGKKIQSQGNNVFPEQWEEIVKAIEECLLQIKGGWI